MNGKYGGSQDDDADDDDEYDWIWREMYEKQVWMTQDDNDDDDV